MIARVIKPDESVIYKGEIYTCGEELEVDDAIGNSLIERGYIMPISDDVVIPPEDEEEEEETEIKDAVEFKDNIDEMSYNDLKAYAKSLDLSAGGTKEELIARIKEFLENLEEVETEDEEEGELPATSMPE